MFTTEDLELDATDLTTDETEPVVQPLKRRERRPQPTKQQIVQPPTVETIQAMTAGRDIRQVDSGALEFKPSLDFRAGPVQFRQSTEVKDFGPKVMPGESAPSFRLRLQAEQAAAELQAEREARTPAGKVRSFLSRQPRPTRSVGGQVAGGVGRLFTTDLDEVAGGVMDVAEGLAAPVIQGAATQLGNEIYGLRTLAERLTGGRDSLTRSGGFDWADPANARPLQVSGFTADLLQGAGQLGVQLLQSATTGSVGSGLGSGAAQFGSVYSSLKQRGFSDDQAFSTSIPEFFIGALEPLMGAGSADQVRKGVLKLAAEEGFEEIVQDSLSMANQYASLGLKPDDGVALSLLRSGALGAILGGGVGVVQSAAQGTLKSDTERTLIQAGVIDDLNPNVPQWVANPDMVEAALVRNRAIEYRDQLKAKQRENFGADINAPSETQAAILRGEFSDRAEKIEFLDSLIPQLDQQVRDASQNPYVELYGPKVPKRRTGSGAGIDRLFSGLDPAMIRQLLPSAQDLKKIFSGLFTNFGSDPRDRFLTLEDRAAMATEDRQVEITIRRDRASDELRAQLDQGYLNQSQYRQALSQVNERYRSQMAQLKTEQNKLLDQFIAEADQETPPGQLKISEYRQVEKWAEDVRNTLVTNLQLTYESAITEAEAQYGKESPEYKEAKAKALNTWQESSTNIDSQIDEWRQKVTKEILSSRPETSASYRTGSAPQGLVMHNLYSENLERLLKAGGDSFDFNSAAQVMPSIGIVHPSTNFTSFGPIGLIGTPQIIQNDRDPSIYEEELPPGHTVQSPGNLNIFPADAYMPTIPDVIGQIPGHVISPETAPQAIRAMQKDKKERLNYRLSVPEKVFKNFVFLGAFTKAGGSFATMKDVIQGLKSLARNAKDTDIEASETTSTRLDRDAFDAARKDFASEMRDLLTNVKIGQGAKELAKEKEDFERGFAEMPLESGPQASSNPIPSWQQTLITPGGATARFIISSGKFNPSQFTYSLLVNGEFRDGGMTESLNLAKTHLFDMWQTSQIEIDRDEFKKQFHKKNDTLPGKSFVMVNKAGEGRHLVVARADEMFQDSDPEDGWFGAIYNEWGDLLEDSYSETPRGAWDFVYKYYKSNQEPETVKNLEFYKNPQGTLEAHIGFFQNANITIRLRPDLNSGKYNLYVYSTPFGEDSPSNLMDVRQLSVTTEADAIKEAIGLYQTDLQWFVDDPSIGKDLRQAAVSIVENVNTYLLASAAKETFPSKVELINGITKIIAQVDSDKSLALGVPKGTISKALDNHRFITDSVEPLVDAALTAFKSHRNAPVFYMEAQPERVVKLNEYVAALVPTNVHRPSEEVLEVLKNAGVRIYFYETPEERVAYQNALAQFKELTVDPDSEYGALYSLAPEASSQIVASKSPSGGTEILDVSPDSDIAAAKSSPDLASLEAQALADGYLIALTPESQARARTESAALLQQLTLADPSGDLFPVLQRQWTDLQSALLDGEAAAAAYNQEGETGLRTYLQTFLSPTGTDTSLAPDDLAQVDRRPAPAPLIASRPSKGRYTYEIYNPGTPGSGPALFAPPSLFEAFANSGYLGYAGGVSLPISDLPNMFKKVAPELTKEEEAQLRFFIDDLVAATKAVGGVRIAILNAGDSTGWLSKSLVHEFFHNAQGKIGNDLSILEEPLTLPELHSEHMLQNPQVKKVISNPEVMAVLTGAQGSKVNTNVAIMEMAAYAAGGQAQSTLGLTDSEAADLLIDYMFDLTTQYGSDALNIIERLVPDVPIVRAAIASARQFDSLYQEAKLERRSKFAQRQLQQRQLLSAQLPNSSSQSQMAGPGDVSPQQSSPSNSEGPAASTTGGETGGVAPPTEGLTTSTGPDLPAPTSDDLTTPDGEPLLQTVYRQPFLREVTDAFMKVLTDNNLKPQADVPIFIQLADAVETGKIDLPKAQRAMQDLGIGWQEYAAGLERSFSRFGEGLAEASRIAAFYRRLYKSDPALAAKLVPPERLLRIILKDLESTELGLTMWQRLGQLPRKMALNLVSTLANNQVTTVMRLPLLAADAMSGFAVGLIQPERFGNDTSAAGRIASGARAVRASMTPVVETILAMNPRQLTQVLKFEGHKPRLARGAKYDETHRTVELIEQFYPSVSQKIRGLSSGLYALDGGQKGLELARQLFPQVKDERQRAKLERAFEPIFRADKFNKSLAGKVYNSTDWAYSQILRPSQWFEYAFRRPFFVGSLIKHLEYRGYDFRAMVASGELPTLTAANAIEDPKARLAAQQRADSFAEALELAMDDALEFTYAYDPHPDRPGIEGATEKAAHHMIRGVNALGPIGAVVEMFPKAIVQGLKFVYEYGPQGALIPGARASWQFVQDPSKVKPGDVERLGQAMTGTMLYVAAHLIRAVAGGDEWWQLKTGQRDSKGEPVVLDVRRYFPLAWFFYADDLVTRRLTGRLNDIQPSRDVKQLLLSARRAGDDGGLLLSTLDWWGADSEGEATKFSRRAAQSLGQLPALPLTPLINLRDLIVQFSESENQRMDVKESGFWGPALDRVPWARTSMMKPAVDPLTPGPRPLNTAPAAAMLLSTRLVPAGSFAEREFNRLGISPYKWLRRDPDFLIDRAQYEAFGRLLTRFSDSWENDPSYQRLSDTERLARWELLVLGPPGQKGVADAAKDLGKQANQPEIMKRELDKLKGPRFQRRAADERLKRAGGQPTP